MKKSIILILAAVFFTLTYSCSSKEGETQNIQKQNADSLKYEKNRSERPLITFVELGSVKCIPCIKMQPVMKAIEAKYAGQVHLIFYDVWKADQKKYAQQYGIRLIPTQVFLDKDGHELYRHEGFFPEAEMDQILQKQGLTPKLNEND